MHNLGRIETRFAIELQVPKNEPMWPESSEGLNKETKEAVYFFSVPFEPLNNWSAHRVEIWGHVFLSSEHAYMWKKFDGFDPEIAQKILEAKSPYEAGHIAHANKDKDDPNWLDKRVEIMEEVLRAKLTQNVDVKDALKRTGTRAIHENSPWDKYWGLGPDGNGESILGKIWMKIRKDI